MATIAKRVKKLICEQIGKPEEEIKDDSSFVNDLGMDSLDGVETIMAFEDEFGIDIPNGDAENIKTVNDAINYITSNHNSIVVVKNILANKLMEYELNK